MRPNRRRRLHTPSSANSTQLLNLSLFIMLLAFFIVLNAISSFEEMKVKPIIESVATAFSSEVQRVDSAPSVTPSPQESINEGETVERLDALFKSQIATFEATRSVRTGVMHVEMPLEDFQKAMTAAGQGDLTKTRTITGLRTYFLPTLISLLQSDKHGRPYRMDMIFHTRDNPPVLKNSDPASLNAAMRNASRYANILEDAGMAQNLVGIGIEKGDENIVDLFFRPHVPYSPIGQSGGAP